MPVYVRPHPRKRPARSKLPPKYWVEYEGEPWGYTILVEPGVVEYDWIEDGTEARLICEILNRGIGPAWDDVEPELRKMQADRNAINTRPFL